MINLARRSYQKELMDRDDIPFAAMAQTLKELNIINTRLGGHAITLKGVKQLAMGNEQLAMGNEQLAMGNRQLAKGSQLTARGSQLIICEIGCGGGDNLFTIYKYCRLKKIPVQFIGIDMNRECIAFAKQQYPELPCQWICSDYAKAEFEGIKPDIIFSSLFCHHFTDEELVSMLQWLEGNSNLGFFINDLHRHWLAYYLIKYITKFFSKSWLVRNDACISVARGFRKTEWNELFRQAGIGNKPGNDLQNNPGINWKWAFRYLVTYKK
jgi:2-polyprenyl-3-methyl-5-hydroxy-6-metoxy-1,4-benzoquinol methylase